MNETILTKPGVIVISDKNDVVDRFNKYSIVRFFTY